MSGTEGTCARTRGWDGEYSGFQRYKSKISTTDDDMSADSDTDKSEKWSELQASSNGYASEPSEKDLATQVTMGGFAEDLGGLRETNKDASLKATEFESSEFDITQQEDLHMSSREISSKDVQIEKGDGEMNQKETDQMDANDTKSSHGKHKDTHKRREKEYVKESKKHERSKDKQAERVERGRKDGKRTHEEISDKKSYKKDRKVEKSQKRDRNVDDDSHRKDKHRSASEKDHSKVPRHDREKEGKKAKADGLSDDEHSQKREKHRVSSKAHHSKVSNKTDREKDSKRAKFDVDKKVTQKGRSSSRSPRSHKRHSSSHVKELGRSPSPRHNDREDREWVGRDKTDKETPNKFRRFGASGLGGYSPRRRRSDAAIKTPSPPTRSPERRKPRAWDLPPPGMDSSIVAAMAAAHQAAAQQAAALASVSSLVTVNPAVTAVTLTQATRPFRRLYVGNVPSTVSDGELMEFMNAAMLSANANHLPGTKPCINCLVNVEKSYAFAEFLTPEDATSAIAFDGITLHGTTLKIRRPKDFVQPANGGADKASPVVDMVSNAVADSPRKVFVGGICPSLSSDKVKEIVTAFGQLKAYHWEVRTKKNCKEAFAFLEYMDPSVTLKACTGLNGMRLGNSILTVAQATPNASLETRNTETLFYGIPEHVKTLMKNPTRVLELQNVITEDEILAMSEAELDEIAEDIRLECIRFGTVKSLHIVKPHDGAIQPSLETTERTDQSLWMGEVDLGDQANIEGQSQQSENHANGANKVTGADTKEAIEGNTENVTTQADVALSFNGSQGNMSVGEPAISKCKALGPLQEVNDHQVECKNLELAETQLGTEAEQYGESKVDKVNGDAGEEPRGSTTRNDILPEESLLDCGAGLNPPFGSDVQDLLLDAIGPNIYLQDSKLGRVYVEFSREEFACQAAHNLHGRMYGDRKIVAGYVSLKLYQKKFRKGLEPQTIEEKQALALAAQEHLNSYIKD